MFPKQTFCPTRYSWTESSKAQQVPKTNILLMQDLSNTQDENNNDDIFTLFQSPCQT